MTISHRIERMDILALAIKDEDKNIALLMIAVPLTKKLLNFLRSVFGFSSIPYGDDVRSK